MIQVQNISFKYPRSKNLFEDFSHIFPSNGLINIAGRNGNGKTTLLKLLSGLIIPHQGKILIDGSKENFYPISFHTSNPESNFINLNGFEVLNFFSMLNKTELSKIDEFKIFKSLPIFNSALKTRFSFCSLGMKQLINLMRTYTKSTPYILLDEPFIGLDAEHKSFIKNYIEEDQNNRLYIITSHETLNWQNSINLNLHKGRLV